jgi:hypothetical protein
MIRLTTERHTFGCIRTRRGDNSRKRALLWRVQLALKPASKALGLHGVFIRGKGLKYLIADGAFKRMQVDSPGACWLDADEHHLGLARTLMSSALAILSLGTFRSIALAIIRCSCTADKRLMRLL